MMSRLATKAPIVTVGTASVLWIEASGFLFGALLHTGISISFLPAFFHDPRIIGASVVEGACGAFLGYAALRVATRQRAAWGIAISAQVSSIGADIAGMAFIAAGLGPDSPFNYPFHRVGISILVIVLGFLLMPRVREAVRHESVEF